MMINRYDMRIKTNYKKCIRTVCIALFSLAFTGCTKDGLNEFGPGNATGKVVMVSLNVSLPPIEETTPTGRYPTVKPFFKNENNSDSSFTVVLEQEQRTAATRVSDGTTKLHNLWLFQFNEDGSMNLNPNSLTVLKECYLEPSLKDAKAYDSFQFVRNGFFCVDAKDSKEDALVFNRIVSLKSSFKLPAAK